MRPDILISRRYTFALLATFFLLSASIIALNFIANPYRLYPTVPTLSPGKSVDLLYILRLHTPYKVESIRPSILIVGNSRAATLPPRLLQGEGQTAYNASMPGATLREIRRMVEHAHATTPLQHVLVGIDISMFRADAGDGMLLHEPDRYRSIEPGLIQGWRFAYQRFMDYWTTLFSTDATMDSLRSLLQAHPENFGFFEDGTWDLQIRNTAPSGYAYRWLVPQMYQDHVDGKFEPLVYDEFLDLLDFTESNGIQTTVLILPVHGLVLNVIAMAGAWQQYLEWQRELVTLVGARPAVTKLFGVENRPRLAFDPLDSEYPLFGDGVHFTSLAGTEVVSCLTGPCNPEFSPTPLDRGTIDAYLRQVTATRKQYAADYPRNISQARRWLDLDQAGQK